MLLGGKQRAGELFPRLFAPRLVLVLVLVLVVVVVPALVRSLYFLAGTQTRRWHQEAEAGLSCQKLFSLKFILSQPARSLARSLDYKLSRRLEPTKSMALARQSVSLELGKVIDEMRLVDLR